ncbi:hypothetical protein GGR56DRAFT_619209 [Xylariaceae sp. FL0804]|nr:hypothetical protein GGR56DRAFT_619209 [Xylariaceae sp. FL0804]
MVDFASSTKLYQKYSPTSPVDDMRPGRLHRLYRPSCVDLVPAKPRGSQQLSSMDPSLKSKIAFFARLEACGNEDDEYDTLNVDEQTYRSKSRSFYHKTSLPQASSRPSLRQQHLPGTVSSRTGSDPGPRHLVSEPKTVAVTPGDPGAKQNAPTEKAAPEISIIPETVWQARRSSRRTTHPPIRANFSTESNNSPSMARNKRKRPTLEMAPESEQIFKGRAFYYIPNDDINPARKMRITKALQHGAVWARNLPEATHIIVDKNLKYTDIKPILDGDPDALQKILVNERYPLDCLHRQAVFDPSQSVEKNVYMVPGVPKESQRPAPRPPAAEESREPLKIKPRRSKRVSASSQKSSDLSQELGYPVSSTQPGEEQRAETPSGATPPQSRSQQELPPRDPDREDELSQCINEVRGDPSLYERLGSDDSDAGTDDDRALSSDDRVDLDAEPAKKRRVSKKSSSKRQKADGGQALFGCMTARTEDAREDNPNAATIQFLKAMQDVREVEGDEFRAQAYRKAINTLRQQPREITTAKEAIRLPNIGKGVAEKIEEFVSTGRSRPLEEARADPRIQALRLFLAIYGVGKRQAKQWVEEGLRSLDDVRTRAAAAGGLSAGQRVGLEHYDDLQRRIPRREVEALAQYVRRAAAAVDPEVELVVGGSYRRGAETSGDIDLIVTRKGTTTTQDLVPFLNRLVDDLSTSGFLTVALSAHRDRDSPGGSKWQGCCVLPRDAYPSSDSRPEAEADAGEDDSDSYRPIWRRIDFLVVPETELGAALIYFTGNDLFNRSMRLLARRKGWTLNQSALSGPGFAAESRDERRIFERLGVPWREPHERWC